MTNNNLKVSLVYFGTTFSYYGFRKIAAIAAEKCDCSVYVVNTGNLFSIKSILFKPKSNEFTDEEIKFVAEAFDQSDIVCISSMSEEALLVKKVISEIRLKNPETFILWGGIHPIVCPEDAIDSDVDAICVGEGEAAFSEFIDHFYVEEKRSKVRNLWFKSGSDIIKNSFRPLLKSDELNNYPPPYFGNSEFVFQQNIGFRLSTNTDYFKSNALSYNTLWTRGCPFKCTYCSNTKFLENDKLAGRIRHASVDYILNEVKSFLRDRPFIRSVSFHDDCFLALDISVITEFSERWHLEIGLPFAIHGVTPVYVNKEKLVILESAGLNRIRMGVQSGSDRILKFYKRPNRIGLLPKAFDIISSVQRGMVPPAYDIIVDNPIENSEDVKATIRLVNNMPRPFTLNMFSLRSIPNTVLDTQLKELNLSGEQIGRNNYVKIAPTLANILVYYAAIMRVPDRFLNKLLEFAHPFHCSDNRFPRLLSIVQLIFYIKRAFQHLRYFDFSVVFGPLGFYLWKLGILRSPINKKNKP